MKEKVGICLKGGAAGKGVSLSLYYNVLVTVDLLSHFLFSVFINWADRGSRVGISPCNRKKDKAEEYGWKLIDLLSHFSYDSFCCLWV